VQKLAALNWPQVIGGAEAGTPQPQYPKQSSAKVAGLILVDRGSYCMSGNKTVCIAVSIWHVWTGGICWLAELVCTPRK